MTGRSCANAYWYGLRVPVSRVREWGKPIRISRKCVLAEQPHVPLMDLQTIKCPVFVIGGDEDVIKEEHTVLIYENIPGSDLWILPASGIVLP